MGPRAGHGGDPREVRDAYGRHYRIGESPERLTGHSRRHQLWRAWLCLAAISPLQYAFGFAVLGLPAAGTWGAVEAMWLLALFVVAQAGTAVPAAWLNRRRIISPAVVVVTGGVLAAAGLASLAHAEGLAHAALGYAGLGGVGAGLVYSTGVATAASWYPEKRVSVIGLVTGGFAVGAVPGIVALAAVTSAGAHVVVLDVLAAVALVVVTVAGVGLVEPPRFWWPGEIDAQSWAIDHKLNPSLPNNVPAVRDYAPSDALRTGALPLMWLIFALATAVSLFGIGFVAGAAVDAGLGMAAAGAALAGLAAVSGVGRPVAGRLSDSVGRSRVLALVLLLAGVAQFGLALSGHLGSAPGFVLSAVLAGLGGGAFYAIFGTLVLEYFGQSSVLQNQSVLYSAKAVGGIAGVGGGALLVSALAYSSVFVIAGVLALVAAGLVRFLKQPGHPALPARPQRGVGMW